MDEKSIHDLADRFLDAWNRHDMRAFGALYAADADFVNVYGMYWKGAEQIANEHQALHDTVFRSSRLSASRIQVKQLGPDVATLHMFWDLAGLVSPRGDPVADRRGILIHVLLRDSGAWKIAATHNTDTVPRPG